MSFAVDCRTSTTLRVSPAEVGEVGGVQGRRRRVRRRTADPVAVDVVEAVAGGDDPGRRDQGRRSRRWRTSSRRCAGCSSSSAGRRTGTGRPRPGCRARRLRPGDAETADSSEDISAMATASTVRRADMGTPRFPRAGCAASARYTRSPVRWVAAGGGGVSRRCRWCRACGGRSRPTRRAREAGCSPRNAETSEMSVAPPTRQSNAPQQQRADIVRQPRIEQRLDHPPAAPSQPRPRPFFAGRSGSGWRSAEPPVRRRARCGNLLRRRRAGRSAAGRRAGCSAAW